MAICNFLFFWSGCLQWINLILELIPSLPWPLVPPPFLIAINMFVPICGNNCVTIHVFLFTDVLLFVDVNKLYDTITNFYVTCFFLCFMFYYNVCVCLFVCMFLCILSLVLRIFCFMFFLGLFLLKFLLFRVHKINKSQFSLNILFYYFLFVVFINWRWLVSSSLVGWLVGLK